MIATGGAFGPSRLVKKAPVPERNSHNAEVVGRSEVRVDDRRLGIVWQRSAFRIDVALLRRTEGEGADHGASRTPGMARTRSTIRSQCSNSFSGVPS
jgi:hypothetical protein